MPKKKIQPIVMPPLTSVSEPQPRWRILAALYTRHFRYLWMAQLTSAFVQRMGDVVMGWLILELTRSPFLVGVVIALRRVGTLLGPWAGVLADRMDRRHLALVFSIFMMGIVFGLASLIYTRHLELWHLFAALVICPRGV